MSTSDYDPSYVHVPTFFVVGQKAIIFNDQGQFLVVLRSTKAGSGGKWSLPGGGLEARELPNEGIEREIREETQLSVSHLKLGTSLLGVDKDQHQTLILGYTCQALSTQVQLNWEHDDFKWVTKTEALALYLGSHARHFIEHLVD